MDQDPPPSTQVVHRVFVDSADQPLKVFVDAAVFNRVKIGRTLKKGGANVLQEIKDADIIIVDPDSQTGERAVADWSSEKAVLQSHWVQQSVQRGKAFLANEDWGGFLAAASVEGSVASDTGPNHLPTPRVTPPDVKSPQGEPAMQSQHVPGGTFQPAQPMSTSPAPQIPPQTPLQMPTGQPIGGIPMEAVLQNYPNAQVTLPASVAAALLASYASQQQQQQQQRMPLGFGQVSQMPNQMPMAMLQGQGFPPQGMPYLQQGGFPPGAQANFSQNMMGMPPSQPMVMQPPLQGQYPGSASPDMHGRRNSSVSASYRGSPMDEDEKSPPLKRKTKSADPSASGAAQKKGRTGEEGRPSKHRRVSDPYELPLPYPHSSPPPPTQLPDTRRRLFTKANGEPSQFWVPVPVRNRLKIAEAIKRNGGKLIPDIAVADYVILGNPLDADWLRQSANNGKVPVKAGWLYDSVDEGEILDFERYRFEDFHIVKKRGRPSLLGARHILQRSPAKGDTTDSEERESEDDEDEKVQKSTPMNKGKGRVAVKKPTIGRPAKPVKTAEKKSTAKAVDHDEFAKSKGKTKAKRKASSPTPTQSGYWEPSPPPPTHVAPHFRGNLYTKEDDDYCDEYIPILLNRNPTSTLSQIAEKLYEKMPHHTLKSWATRISHASRREKLEKWRRRAEILNRKVREERSANVDARQATHPDASLSDSPMAQSAGLEEESTPFDPLTLLASFFADGLADNLSDSQVWNTMAQQYPQMSAQEWEDYWMEHSEAVNQEVSRLSNLHGTDEHAPKTEPE
ncbi:hypothetical protein BD311DRAFT_746010 [Dichomitus squalens]|uniref:BRCT domain-containing protein n=1 Tax=Dichomitus squalens TaxID=114155 RepID=A0A4Q9N8M7_9APHY|nr:hypothetical protein BD311DRAFT_746010 [Dichomitus squalens]